MFFEAHVLFLLFDQRLIVGTNHLLFYFMVLCAVVVLVCCISGLELHRDSEQIMYIWDYYLSDIAQTKAHQYKQGRFVLDKGGNVC